MARMKKRSPSGGSFLEQPLYHEIENGNMLCEQISAMWQGATLELLSPEPFGKQDVFLMTPQCWDEFAAIVHWGKEHPLNVLEQRFRFLGMRFRDKKRRYCLAMFCQSIPTARSAYSAEKADLEPLNDERELFRNRPELFNPFAGEFGSADVTTAMGHTHPNSLGVFMSGTDDRAHELACTNEAHITFVANPHTRTVKAWIGTKKKPIAVMRCCAQGLE